MNKNFSSWPWIIRLQLYSLAFPQKLSFLQVLLGSKDDSSDYLGFVLKIWPTRSESEILAFQFKRPDSFHSSESKVTKLAFNGLFSNLNFKIFKYFCNFGDITCTITRSTPPFKRKVHLKSPRNEPNWNQICWKRSTSKRTHGCEGFISDGTLSTCYWGLHFKTSGPFASSSACPRKIAESKGKRRPDDKTFSRRRKNFFCPFVFWEFSKLILFPVCPNLIF